jgi:asparagine synthase (glutamine-hydrolysing)
MCGIAGILKSAEDGPVDEIRLRRMLSAIRHRGPDQFGILVDNPVGLASARLSIIDPGNGRQPIANEDGSLWIVLNGEIFNYRELRPDLEARGHRFRTDTDTEVFLRLFEEFGPACLSRVNGQFAVAIWNRRTRNLFLARDRFGVRPLFYAWTGRTFHFASEIKALLTAGIPAAIDPAGLSEAFTFWSTVTPRSAFEGIQELPPAHWMRVSADRTETVCYWKMPFGESPAQETELSVDACTEELRELLTDAVRLRLRADVPVAAYLSGGLDSSVIAALAREQTPANLHTFSIAFTDSEFDERDFQERMAAHLGTRHEVVEVDSADIGRSFPDVVWHCETPILRTAPAPLLLLSARLQQRGFKVALTGEGADEMLGGYDIFKEAKIRRFCAAQPASPRRRELLRLLYPEISELSRSGFLAAFFLEGIADVGSPFYSHAIRWRNGRRLRRFFSDDLAALPVADEPAIALPRNFQHWEGLERAQYLEIALFLSGYLLSSQGDRMSMANAVEGRFPFLDYRVAEFSARLPARLKLRALTEKFLLRKMAAPLLPPEIVHRRKRPYRAPIHRAFFNNANSGWVEDLLTPERLREAGWFKPSAVGQLVAKIKSGGPVGETDDMALAGIISTQLLHERFVAHFPMIAPLPDEADLKVFRLNGTPQGKTRQSTPDTEYALP